MKKHFTIFLCFTLLWTKSVQAASVLGWLATTPYPAITTLFQHEALADMAQFHFLGSLNRHETAATAESLTPEVDDLQQPTKDLAALSEAVSDTLLLSPQSVEARLEHAMKTIQGDWSVVFMDLDDMRDFNQAVGDDVVDTLYRDRIAGNARRGSSLGSRLDLVQSYFPDATYGFIGGDEIMIVVPGNSQEIFDKTNALRRAFKAIDPHPELGPMTVSAGIVTKEELQGARSYKRARELSSHALAYAKNDLKKDAVAAYVHVPLTKAWQLRNFVRRVFTRKLRNAFHPRMNWNPAIQRLAARKTHDTLVIFPDEKGRNIPAMKYVNQFERIDDFRAELARNAAWGAPAIVGSIQPYYGGSLLRKAIAKLKRAGSRVYGEIRAGFKALNIFDSTYYTGDEMIRADKVSLAEAFMEATKHLPAEWLGQILIVRGPPDTFYFALLPARIKGVMSPDGTMNKQLEEAAVDILGKTMWEAHARLMSNLNPGLDVSFNVAMKTLQMPEKFRREQPESVGPAFATLEMLQLDLAQDLAQSGSENSPVRYIHSNPGNNQALNSRRHTRSTKTNRKRSPSCAFKLGR